MQHNNVFLNLPKDPKSQDYGTPNNILKDYETLTNLQI